MRVQTNRAQKSQTGFYFLFEEKKKREDPKLHMRSLEKTTDAKVSPVVSNRTEARRLDKSFCRAHVTTVLVYRPNTK